MPQRLEMRGLLPWAAPADPRSAEDSECVIWQKDRFSYQDKCQIMSDRACRREDVSENHTYVFFQLRKKMLHSKKKKKSILFPRPHSTQTLNWFPSEYPRDVDAAPTALQAPEPEFCSTEPAQNKVHAVFLSLLQPESMAKENPSPPLFWPDLQHTRNWICFPGNLTRERGILVSRQEHPLNSNKIINWHFQWKWINFPQSDCPIKIQKRFWAHRDLS